MAPPSEANPDAQPGNGELTFEPATAPRNAQIKVVGVGGGGGNAVQHMVADALDGVEYIAANTDDQALRNLAGPNTLQLGAAQTKGLGAGADPEVGRASAAADREAIVHALDGADMVFITAGMGGGTGTGAAPVIAEIAKGLDILTVAVVTKPFDFENRTRVAEEGIAALRANVDSLIAIPNDKVLDVLGDDADMEEAFAAANEVLRGAVQGVADVILRPGKINADFRDERTVMSEGGMAIMGTGQAAGDDRAKQATERAIHNPLLDDVDLRGARAVLVNATTSPSANMTVREFRIVGDTIRELTTPQSTVIVGMVYDPTVGEEMRVTVVATGLGGSNRPGIDRPEIAVDNTRAAPPARAARSGGYGELETRAAPAQRAVGSDVDPRHQELLDYDELMEKVPTFIRRQAQ